MLPDYRDIRSLIKQEPIWFDSNGVPRYQTFGPQMLDVYDIYSVYAEIACQSCRKHFFVGVGRSSYSFDQISGDFRQNSLEELAKHFHYGDPPRHGCVGDTMNCVDLRIVEAWDRDTRISQYEGPIDDKY